MTDMTENLAEHHAERLAIMQESNVPDTASAAADDLHRFEVRSVIRQYFPDGQRAADYFAQVEKMRGKGPADRLRDDCRAAWKLRREEMTGQS